MAAHHAFKTSRRKKRVAAAALFNAYKNQLGPNVRQRCFILRAIAWKTIDRGPITLPANRDEGAAGMHGEMLGGG